LEQHWKTPSKVRLKKDSSADTVGNHFNTSISNEEKRRENKKLWWQERSE